MSLEFLETQNLHINNQSSNYVLTIFDPSRLVIMNLAVPNTVTIPNDATVNFLIGARIYVQQTGVGQTSIVGGVGVTINSQSGVLTLAQQYAMCVLIKTAVNTWTMQGGNIALIPTTNYGLFAQTSSSTPVANTITETSVIDGGVGTLTVPANQFKVGDSFQANLSGHIDSRNNDTLRIRIKTAAGVLLADTGNITMAQCVNQHWDLKTSFTIRSLGVAGVASIASTLMFTYTKDASNTFEGENNSLVNNTTFDTTITNTLLITAQWNAASPLNSIYSEVFVLNKIY